MSGDVQPRKRKDKKRKKDDLGVEEPRGTAAALGEGDVFMHSQHEHGTGGHWCAKIIFFSLLAVLITLIGLIILENRGLTELEANSVESRYSGVLEGWLEDAPDDDHHDEHTLELLKHHNEDGQEQENVSQEDDHDDEENDNEDDSSHNENLESEEDVIENEQDASNEDELQEDDDDENRSDPNSDEQLLEDSEEADDDDNERGDDNYKENERRDGDDDDEDDDDGTEEDISKENEDEEHSSNENDDQTDDPEKRNEDSIEDNDDDNDQSEEKENDVNSRDSDDNSHIEESIENDDVEDSLDEDFEDHEDHEEQVEDTAIEVEKLEKEVSDDDHPSQEIEEDAKSEELSKALSAADDSDNVDSGEDEEFLEIVDVDEPLPVVERIVVPKGKPFTEVEDEATTIKPTDTLAEEEEYERRQEELRREQAQASHVWLKLVVGGALLVATHAVLSRAVAPRDDTPASEAHEGREDTPSMIDRRMTLIPEQRAQAIATPREITEEIKLVKEFEKETPIVQSIPHTTGEESEEEVIHETKVTGVQPAIDIETEDKELYSDDEDIEEEEVEELFIEEKEIPKQVAPISKQAAPITKQAAPITKQAAPFTKQAAPITENVTAHAESDEEVPDDVEILDDEQIDEELEEEEDVEEEISDVDDAELLSRLEAKYGRLPEPHRPEQKHKDGGNSIEDNWPGEPSEKYWRQQLDEAEHELGQGEWSAAIERVSVERLKGSCRARWILARAIDASAEAKRDNRLLTRAITAYLDVLKMNERLSDTRLTEIAERTLDRIRFRGNYLSAEPVYRLLIRRFPEVVDHRNNLTVSLLMANRADLAEEVIKETLQKWPDDRVSLAHLGFILKTQHNRLEEAVVAFQKALEGDIGPATEPRFYYHLGDAYLLLGRFAEAHEVHKRGAKLGHFLSPAQRSLYNVNRLKSRPWWNIEQTPYIKLARALEKSWKEILKEGQAAQALYEKEKEGLKERGEWSQLDIFIRGQEVPGRCKKAPVTCSIVRSEAAAAGCRRGQIKFSAIGAGTHVRPHVGPTNCRLRMHLGLSNTKDTYIRVDKETRQWQVGKVFVFDDSFEHEVWHNGTGSRLVLIVDVWHPDLTIAERSSLAPI